MADKMDITSDTSWSMPDAPVLTPSTSNAVVVSCVPRDPSEQDVSQRMLQLGRSMNIIGPKLISRDRYEAEALGSGAKFEVFGHKLPDERDSEDAMLWEGIDVRRIAFKRGKTSLKKPQELDDPSSSWVAVVSESQENVSEVRTDEQKAKQLEQVAAVVREMKALARDNLRSHRNIVKLYAWGFDMDDFNTHSLMTPILVEDRAWGTFSELLATERLGHTERFNLCHDALQGLVALHEDGLYHGDINPKNILVYQEEENIVAKISDFSHCGFLPTEVGDMLWYQGTKGWQAPEVGDTLPTSKADIVALEAYSFGLVLWSALGLAGKSPLATSPKEPASIPKFAHRCIESYNLPIEVQNRVVHLLPRLLHQDPNSRFWLSRDMLEEKLPIAGRRLILHTSAPINLSMDDNYKHLDEFIRKRRKDRQPAVDPGMPEITNMGAFLRLLVEEAYVRDIAWRLAAIPALPDHKIPLFKRPDPSEYQAPRARDLEPYAYIPLDVLEQTDGERQTGEFKSLTANSLFDIAMGFLSFDTIRGLLYLRQASIAGDVRAQALYPALSGRSSTIPSDTLQQWTFDAITTGFTLVDQPVASSTTRLAVTQFRENAGYNSDYYFNKTVVRSAQSYRMDLEALRNHLRSSKFENFNGQIGLFGAERETYLHMAVLAGDLELVKRVVDLNVGRPWALNSRNERNETALLMAARSGNSEIIKTLLEAGASANTRDGQESPLHWLFVLPSESMQEICDLLISKGKARIEAHAQERPMTHFPFFMPKGTPLVWAIAAGSLPAVTAISNAIVSNPDLTHYEKERCFAGAIKLAMVRYESDMMKTMLEAAKSQGLNLAGVASEAFDWSVISVPEDSDDIPITATPLIGDWKDEIIRALRHENSATKLRETLIHLNSLQSKASRVSEDDGDETINLSASFTYLKQVIIQHDSASTNRLLQRYGSSYSRSDLGTALFLNMHHNWALPSSPQFPVFMDIFRGLISAGADVNMPNPLPNGLGNTLMHIIIRKYTDEYSRYQLREIRGLVLLLMKVLQSCGAEVNRKNTVGMTVMDYALHTNTSLKFDEEIVDLLHIWGSKSTFRLLPMSAEARIGNWNARQLEWQEPERERPDVRKTGGGLAVLWGQVEQHVGAQDAGMEGLTDGEETVDGGDDVSMFSEAETVV